MKHKANLIPDTLRGTSSRNARRGSKGFTIVELLVVIVIIAILAVITIVAFNGLQERARTSAVSSALSQASRKLTLYNVDNGAYPAALADAGIASSEVTYEYTSTATSWCVTGTQGNTSLHASDTQSTPTSGGCNGHTWPGGVAMTNLVTNGDFSGGTSGWSSAAGSYSISATAGVMSHSVATAGAVSDHLSAASTASNIIAGNKYYISYDINPFREHAPRMYIGGASTGGPLCPVGSFTRVSAVITTTTTARVHIYANSYSATGAVVGATTAYRYVSTIDLTATFGAGKEPTKSKMDAIMQRLPNGWFNGTVTANTTGIL